MRAVLIFTFVAACSTPEPPPSREVAALTQVPGPGLNPVSYRTRLIRTFLPSTKSSVYSWRHIDSVGDWNGDGIIDLAVNERMMDDAGAMGVVILSSRDGRLLADLKGSSIVVRAADTWAWDKPFASLGDINADQRADIVLLSSGIGADGSGVSVLTAFGADIDKPLWTQNIEVPVGCMPSVVQRLGDLDHDGVDDLGLGIPPWVAATVHRDHKSKIGWIEARSGKDGRLLWRANGPPNRRAGWELARHADVDRDGVEDVAVLSLNLDPWDTHSVSSEPADVEQAIAAFESAETLPALIEIRSGASGAVLKTTPQKEPRIKLGSWQSPTPYHLRGGEDIDGDGVRDLAVRTVRDGEINVVHAISGRTGQVFARLTPHPDPNGREETWFPSDIAIASDLDGDGWRDLLIGHDEVGTEQGMDYGAIYVQSSRTNEVLTAVWGTSEDSKLGHAITWLGDTDGDGAPEFAAITLHGVRIWAIERD